MDQPIEPTGKRTEVMYAPQGSQQIVALAIFWATLLWGPMGENMNAHKQ